MSKQKISFCAWCCWLVICVSSSFIHAKPCASDVKKGLRFATFNASLNRQVEGALYKELASPESKQAEAIASLIREVDADVLLILELDKNRDNNVLTLFHDKYLTESGKILYPYRHHFDSNTGVDTGLDLDRNGRLGDPGDAQGFGRHEGQYAFALLSKLPFRRQDVRQFRTLLWKDFGDSRISLIRRNAQLWYSDAAKNLQRLSSKNHVAVPLNAHGQMVWVFAAHPTPPVFDGAEDRNGHRNYDEIRLLKRLVEGKMFISSDSKIPFKLPRDSSFVVMGDLNADPDKGDAIAGAIDQLLLHPMVNREAAIGSRVPSLTGKAANDKYNTSTFGLRVDYILPSRDLEVSQSGLCEPGKIGGKSASDHHLVWMDLNVTK